MLRTRLILASLLVLSYVPAAAPARTWYDSTAKHKTEARFVDVQGDTVHLRRDSDRKLIKIKKSRMNKRELELLTVLDHKDQAEAAKHLLRQDLQFAYRDDGRIFALNFYEAMDDPDEADPEDLDNRPEPTSATDADLEQASSLPGVEYVRLAVTDAVTPTGLAYLTRLPNVTDIELTFQTSADVDPYVESLAPLKGLKRFFLADCGHVTDASLRVITQWTDLGNLSILQKLPGAPGLTDAGVLGLSPLTNLFGLHIVGHDLSDACLAVVESMPKLEYVTWGSANHPFTARGAAHISMRTGMAGLMVRAQLSDDALPALGNVEGFRELDLAACQVSDAQLAPIGRFTGLRNRRKITSAVATR